MRRTATHHIFNLLPEIREYQQFGKVGTDKRCSRNHTAGYIRPVGAIQTIAYGGRFCTYAGSKRLGIRTRMTSQNKFKRIENHFRPKYFRISPVEEIVLV